MKNPFVSTKIIQNFTDEEKALGRSNLGIDNPSDSVVIGYERDGVLDTTYNGIKLRTDDTGNEHVGLRKGETWYGHGLLAPTSPGSNKTLETNSDGKLVWTPIENPVLHANTSGNMKITLTAEEAQRGYAYYECPKVLTRSWGALFGRISQVRVNGSGSVSAVSYIEFGSYNSSVDAFIAMIWFNSSQVADAALTGHIVKDWGQDVMDFSQDLSLVCKWTFSGLNEGDTLSTHYMLTGLNGPAIF